MQTKQKIRVPRRPLIVPFLTAVVTLVATSAWAQEAATRPPRDLGMSVVSTLIFGVVGIVLAVVGFKVFDLVIKHDIEKEIFDNKNMAAAVLCGAVVLGVCMIIAATILSP